MGSIYREYVAQLLCSLGCPHDDLTPPVAGYRANAITVSAVLADVRNEENNARSAYIQPILITKLIVFVDAFEVHIVL